MNKPTLSIVIPVWETAKAAEKITKKILKDKFQDLELIIVDDGSTDDTAARIQAIKDDRLHYYYKKNGGPSSARNLGIQKAKGKFIMFIDSDDDIASGYLTKQMANMADDNYSTSVVGIKYHRVFEDTYNDVYISPIRARHSKESLEEYMLYLLLKDGRMYGSINKVFYLNIIKENNLLFDEALEFSEDTNFVLSYLKYAEKMHRPISFILEPLYTYHYGTTTSTVKKSSVVWANWQKSYAFLKNWVGKKPTLRAKTLLRLVHLRWRISYLRAVKRVKRGTTK